MTILLFVLFLAVGFFLLIKGADYLVDGASSLAKRFKVSDLVIGLTIVTLGTSAPELIVSLVSAIKGQGDISIGNVVGSNIVNLLFILGLSAIVRPLIVKRNTAHKEIPFSLLAAIAALILLNDRFFSDGGGDVLGRGDGLILILFFIIFVFYSFATAKGEQGVVEDIKEENRDIKKLKFATISFMIIGGLAALSIGGNLVVRGASGIALAMGISEKLIGLTIVAIGTSLPELFSSIIAARKGNSDMAIGNVVGSNIFNIFWILGMASLISPLKFNSVMNFDLVFLVVATSVMPILIYTGKKRVIDKREGWFMVSSYFAYVIFLIIRK